MIQELYSLLLAHYAVRALMAEAAAQAGLAPLGLSFSAALDLVRVAIDDVQLVTPAPHDALHQRLLRALAAQRLPVRACRTNPRVVKRKMSTFKLKRGSPPLSSQHLAPFANTILLLPQAAPPHALDLPCPGDAFLVPCTVVSALN